MANRSEDARTGAVPHDIDEWRDASFVRPASIPSPVAPQPPPTGDGTTILELLVEDVRRRAAQVIADLREKSAAGEVKYGTPLRAFNGRNARADAYQEQIDGLFYARQQMEEDHQVAARARAAALGEAVTALEDLLGPDVTDPADELGRQWTAILRRAISVVQDLLAQPPPPGAP